MFGSVVYCIFTFGTFTANGAAFGVFDILDTCYSCVLLHSIASQSYVRPRIFFPNLNLSR